MEAGWARMNDLIIIQASQVITYYGFDLVGNLLMRVCDRVCARTS